MNDNQLTMGIFIEGMEALQTVKVVKVMSAFEQFVFEKLEVRISLIFLKTSSSLFQGRPE